jgi:hypothetical protein
MRNLTRRSGIAILGGAALRADRLPPAVPPGVAAILDKTLAQDPASLNTDWFGTMLVKGLLEWAPRGVPEARGFARRWFEAHLASNRLAPYSGHRSRTVRAGGIVITTYAGHFGLSFPCYELARQTGDERARAVCREVAAIILHRTARNHLGMVMHDDASEFTIPDVCYFVVTPLMIAFDLDRERGQVFRDQATFQLRSFLDVFLVKETGLARTILFKSGLGSTYWTRATGWLLWAVLGVLRYLPADDPAREGFVRDLNTLAGGIARAQHESGALRVLIDDPSTPLETTGTAMCATGLHEAVRRGWLQPHFRDHADRAWAFVRSHVSPDGRITQAYTGWAVPAEKHVIEMDRLAMGWIPGFLLSAAAEMTT